MYGRRVNLSQRVGRRCAAVALAVVTLTSAPLAAQGYPFSQRGTVSQLVAFTQIAIEYGRPTARGRALFGALVKWDSIWHPGADSATQITFSHDVTVEGQAVRAGTYSVWLVPHERAPWSFILSRATGIQHTPYPGAGQDELRIDVPVEQLSPVETLLYSFPMVLKDAAQLRIQWGVSALTVRIVATYRPG